MLSFFFLLTFPTKTLPYVDRKCIIFSYVYTLYHKTSTLQILGSVSEQIHISLFRNLVFSIPDLIARPLTE